MPISNTTSIRLIRLITINRKKEKTIIYCRNIKKFIYSNSPILSVLFMKIVFKGEKEYVRIYNLGNV